ncbi:hypothetical protein [Limimaricola cinnabarinus]|uniref:hypothetical protein n=1 Tax=Limimaricola cinnabarinus TaxID=1125964 RepID=UPI002FE01465
MRTESELKLDEIYQQFVQELTSELIRDAFEAFDMAKCPNRHQPHFLSDLREAIGAEIRRRDLR